MHLPSCDAPHSPPAHLPQASLLDGLLESAGDAVFRVAASGTIRAAGTRAQRFHGYAPGCSLVALVHDVDQAALRHALDGAAMAHEAALVQARFRIGEQDIWFELRIARLTTGDDAQIAGGRARHVGAARDRRAAAPHGHPRRADRTAQPPAAVGPHPHGDRQCAPLGPGLFGRRHRPGRLQESQRRPGPPARRRRAAHGRHPPAQDPARQRHPGARRRRRIRRRAAGHLQRRADQARHRAA